jgi:hypothetical protein
MHAACFHGNAECLVLLLDWKVAPVDVTGGGGCTPLHTAAQRGSVLCCLFLLMCGASRDRRNDLGQTAAEVAAANGNMTSKAALELPHAALSALTRALDEHEPGTKQGWPASAVESSELLGCPGLANAMTEVWGGVQTLRRRLQEFRGDTERDV